MVKILHITASYQPAYVYRGPIYSVAALCEGLVESRRSGDGSPKFGIESEKRETKVKKQEARELKSEDRSRESEVESEKKNRSKR